MCKSVTYVVKVLIYVGKILILQDFPVWEVEKVAFFKYLYLVNWKNALSDYTHYLRLERGLSKNSVQNYGRDPIQIPLHSRSSTANQHTKENQS